MESGQACNEILRVDYFEVSVISDLILVYQENQPSKVKLEN